MGMLPPPRAAGASGVRPTLLLALVAATALPILIHTVMLDRLGIPDPTAMPRHGWPPLPDRVLTVLAAFALDDALRRARAPWPAPGRVLFLFLAVGAINQALLRLPVMLNVVSTRWTIYPFVDNLPSVLLFAATALLVVAAAPLARAPAARIPLALLVALAVWIGLAPALASAFAPIVAADASREGDQLYTVPYDWHVDVPSTLTFLEPALGAIAAAFALARAGLPFARIAVVLFAASGGPFFRLFLYLAFAPSGPVLALLSEAQFSLQNATLALIAAWAAAASPTSRPPAATRLAP